MNTPARPAAPHGPPMDRPRMGRGGPERLALHYARTRDPRARSALILHHQPLVRMVACRFLESSETLDDLMQIGNIGLIRAIDNFDPAKAVRFSAFAVPGISGEIMRHFRDKRWHLKVPRRFQELSLLVRKSQPRLAARLGRPPTTLELAADLGVSEDEAEEALVAARASNVLSLNTRLGARAGETATLMDVIGADDAALEDVVAYSDLRAALERLTAREGQILYLRFCEELPQSKIARGLGLSQMQISRLERQALERLRRTLTAQDPPPTPASGGARRRPEMNYRRVDDWRQG